MKYVCGYCGKTYNNLEDAIACEDSCVDKEIAKREAEQKAQEEFEKDSEGLKKIFELYSDAKRAVSEAREESHNLCNTYQEAIDEFREKHPNHYIHYLNENGKETIEIKEIPEGTRPTIPKFGRFDNYLWDLVKGL